MPRSFLVKKYYKRSEGDESQAEEDYGQCYSPASGGKFDQESDHSSNYFEYAQSLLSLGAYRLEYEYEKSYWFDTDKLLKDQCKKKEVGLKSATDASGRKDVAEEISKWFSIKEESPRQTPNCNYVEGKLNLPQIPLATDLPRVASWEISDRGLDEDSEGSSSGDSSSDNQMSSHSNGSARVVQGIGKVGVRAESAMADGACFSVSVNSQQGNNQSLKPTPSSALRDAADQRSYIQVIVNMENLKRTGLGKKEPEKLVDEEEALDGDLSVSSLDSESLYRMQATSGDSSDFETLTLPQQNNSKLQGLNGETLAWENLEEKLAQMLEEDLEIVLKNIRQFLDNNRIPLEEIAVETGLEKGEIRTFMEFRKPFERDKMKEFYRWYLTKILRPPNGSGDDSFTCYKCGKIFAYESYLERHIKYVCPDSTGRTWKCAYCGKAFQYPCYLRRHIRSHTGESPYKCDKCERAFVRSTDLQRHIRNHTGEKPYCCSECSRAFARSTDLKRHMRTHTGEKPYKCWQCRKSFSQSGSLQTHLHTHNKEALVRKPKNRREGN